MSLLPQVATDEESEALRTDQSVWSAALVEICGRHGVPGPAQVLPEGSAIVAATEQHIVKLFEPWNHRHYETEVGGLRFLDGKTTAPTPAIHAVGELEDWHYVIMTRLAGATLDAVWQDTTVDDRRRIAHQLGRFAAEVHALPLDGLTHVDRDWDGFMARQVAGLTRRHEGQGGLSPTLLNEVQSIVVEQTPDSRRVFLHTELTSDNITVTHGAHGWQLAGVFDFEPAMVGAPMYDWAAISIFIARGDATVLRAAAAGYDENIDVTDPSWRSSVLTQCVLHRYSHIPNFLRILAAQQPASVNELLDLFVPAQVS